MSLQVWLPLNGNLNNQGLLGELQKTDDDSYINGKLGKSLSTGGCKMSSKQTTQVLNNNAISICFWVYVDAPTGTTENGTLLFGTEGTGADNNRKFSLFNYPTVNDFHWSWMNDTANTVFTYGVLEEVLPSYEWTHVAITYQNPIGTIYINGEKVYSFNGVSNSSTFEYETQVIHNSSYLKRNDFRIYDHCLSPKEVKEISKGLVCHYKLSGVGGENLLSEHVSCGHNIATSTSEGARTSFYGSYGIGIPAAENADTYFSLYTNKQLTQGKTYTLSCIVSGLLDGTSYSFPLFVQTNGNMGNLVLNHNGLCSVTFTMNYTGSIPTSTDKYGNTVYKIFMDDNNRTIASGQTQFYATNFKLEEGSKATPWCPNPVDTLYSTLGYNDNIEYDCSGYGNNGTKVGDIAWSGDTARYSGSYKFDGASYIITPPDGKIVNILNSNTHTISAWININELSSDYQAYFVCRTPSGSYTDCQVFLGIKSSNIVNGYYSDDREIPYSLEINKWYHIVFASNNKVVTCYVNGVKITTITKGDLNISSTAIPTIGADSDRKSCYFNGMISDVRIYSTCLSDEDIKSLYNVSASIDKTGVLSAYEFIEEGC